MLFCCHRLTFSQLAQSKPAGPMLAPSEAAHLLVEQMDVELAAGDHGYPELGAELVVQLAQRAHEQLPVCHHRLVAGLGWRIRPQGCTKVMLCTCAAAAAVRRSPCNACSLARIRPQTAWTSWPERLHPQSCSGWLGLEDTASLLHSTCATHKFRQLMTGPEAWHNAGTVV